MATDKLYSILSFVAVPLGGTATLPHGLILRDTPVQPDLWLLQFPVNFEFVAQTATTITIRNTANAVGNCLVWVFAIHPVERLLGLSPDDGLMTQGLTPRPFVPGSPNSGGAGGPVGSYVVVFRPGGVAAENVVTTWADVLARLALLQGERVLQFDDSVVSPIIIPAGGPYAMEGVTWSTVPDSIVQVQIPEGASFTRLRTFDGRLHLRFTGATPPIADFGEAPPQIDTVVIDHGAEMFSSGTGALFSVTGDAQFFIGDNAGLFLITHAVVNVAAAVTLSIFVQGSESLINGSTLASIVGSTLNLVAAASGLALLSQAQPGVLGTFNVTNATRTRNFPTAVLVANTPLTTTAPTQLVLVDPTGGAFAVTLPAAADVPGQTIRLKNATASILLVTLTAGGGDNIDGAATLVLTGANFHTAVTSDGVNTWYVTD
jgi:hypothetical protein